MSLGREPLFLARQGYRRRRLEDAARFLPILGAILLIFPALWADEPGAGSAGTAGRGLFLFGAWFLLILAAGLLSRRLLASEAPGEGPEAGGEGGGGQGDAGRGEGDGEAG